MNSNDSTVDFSAGLSAQQRIHKTCEQFIAAWKECLNGNGSDPPRPDIAAYLEKCPEELRTALFNDLLDADLYYRQKQGEKPAVKEYQSRFPEMGKLIQMALSEDELPEKLGRYRVIELLGEGTFGKVYRAFDDGPLQRDVAIKVPRKGRDSTTFLTEAKVLSQLRHPNIVTVHDSGETEDGDCFIVSEFIDGTDLAKRIERNRPTSDESAEIIAQIADALNCAHERSIYHRDIKPANILMDKAGTPYVADFGLALTEEDYGRGPRWAGSLQYMSPEQVRGESHLIDGRSDIFSLGVVIYELLTGHRPFVGSTEEVIIERIQSFEPRSLRERDKNIDEELQRICQRALSKRIVDRYPTALDMADDLRHFKRGKTETSHASGEHAGDAAKEKPAAGEAVKIVPKGLRSFDKHDADFFLKLLPGARDRDGLPESIRFWKTRIEETGADKTFRVGLIYGPSGCGKSSLVKAGLIPRLAKHVIRVYVEASGEQTETRLANSLREAVPNLAAEAGLVELLVALRRADAISGDQKVLIVLDQFEQWLHANRGQFNTELTKALRHCNGSRLQCLLMVRDEFWMPATRFMEEVESRLLLGENSAAVDLFDQLHAKQVLREFGRAYGRLPADLADVSAEQDSFLDQIVGDLTDEDGKIVSVQLALFADMVKGKPWTPQTFKDVGGAKGIGVTFLQETFDAKTAPPSHRLHKPAAIKVLQALLPESGADIKGSMRSESDLVQASEYDERPADFQALLNILNTETRLLTPTDPEGAAYDGEANPQNDTATPYYQLTHDYLVPSLRHWLNLRERDTLAGRARIRLRERAAAWAVRQENKQLPAWWETIDIGVFTRRKDWTTGQKKMMGRASRYHGARTGILAVCLVITMFVSVLARNAIVAQGFVQRLKDAQITSIPSMVSEANNLRRWVEPRLKEEYSALSEDEKLRVSLILSEWEDGSDYANYLVQQLLDVADAHEVGVICKTLAKRQRIEQDQLWQLLTEPRPGEENRCLRAAAALAWLPEPEGYMWPKQACADVGVQLVSVPANLLGPWMENLGPVKDNLIEPLSDIFVSASDPDNPFTPLQCSLAADVLATYAADDPETLLRLLKRANVEQFAKLFPPLQTHGDTAIKRLEKLFDGGS